ncbi:RNase H family protein [Fervidobacterium thailandense]|uniref:RNase H type-1 domain-containing protein n=1 Tax=Fervidobacterium thailandense TaxID=1008305 RepID=A0A1E3G3B2_9BACT|nr:RNase H family protein [Fervidobacterium thailandense]ODN30650.1 hypothetical protein A4H02_03670 [Fervidobacterium thailandense]
MRHETSALEIYVDGSYRDGKISGAVYVPSTREEYYFCLEDEQLAKHRNVSGELLATVFAINLALERSVKHVVIYHDYEGIQKWVTGEWEARTELTRAYKDFLLRTQKSLRVDFVKVAAHKGVEFNNYVDKLAKFALNACTSNLTPDIMDKLLNLLNLPH